MMDAEDQYVFIAVLKNFEKAIAQSWALQGILDSAGVLNWRQTLEKVVTGILPDIHARLRPLSDAILGLPPLGSQDTSLPEWRENMQKLIDRLLEFQGKRQSD
ncbi:MAG TPA: hypothetical protein VFY05_00360 [Candidatus Angelobacter sp.]|nr:hypothetical protein [Candidatus Angelobacter sp.]